MKQKINNLAIVASIDFQLLLLTEKDRVIGGTSSVIKNIINYLDAEHIFLFGVTHEKSLLKSEIKINDKITFVPVIYIPKNSKIPSRIIIYFKSRNINKFLRKYKIQTVYSHTIEISYWINKKHQVVQHMHGATNAISKASFKSLRFSVFIKLWDKLRERSLTKANKIIAIDQDCVSLAENFNDSKNIIEIPNFVDTSVFYSDQTESTYIKPFKNKKIVLFVGRIEEVKGLELFVDIIKDLNKKDNDWIGLIVGKGTYQKQIEKYINLEKVMSLIHFTGAIFNQNELRKIYSQSNVLLLTSHHEGIPMTILESLACKTPVLATEVGGIKSLKKEGIPCYIINNRDSIKFCNKILEIDNTKYNKGEMTFPYSAEKASILINKLLY